MGAEARLFGVRNGIDKNAPCPCGSGQKFKCCRKAEVDPDEMALAKEEAAEHKETAMAALVAEREAAMRQAEEEAQQRREAQLAMSETQSVAMMTLNRLFYIRTICD